VGHSFTAPAGQTESRGKIAVFKLLFQPHWRWYCWVGLQDQ